MAEQKVRTLLVVSDLDEKSQIAQILEPYCEMTENPNLDIVFIITDAENLTRLTKNPAPKLALCHNSDEITTAVTYDADEIIRLPLDEQILKYRVLHMQGFRHLSPISFHPEFTMVKQGDSDFRLTMANRACLNLFNLPSIRMPIEIAKIKEIILDEDYPFLQQESKAITEGKDLGRIEFRINKGVSFIWIRLSYKAFFDNDCLIVHGECEDITTEKEENTEAINNKHLISAMLSHIPFMLITLDTTDSKHIKRIAMQSASGFYMGYRFEEYRALYDQDAYALIHPEDISAVRNNLEKGLRDSVPFTINYRAMHKNGEYHHISCQGAPFISPEGTITTYLTYFDSEPYVREMNTIKQQKEILRELYRKEKTTIWIYDASDDCFLDGNAPEDHFENGTFLWDVHQKVETTERLDSEGRHILAKALDAICNGEKDQSIRFQAFCNSNKVPYHLYLSGLSLYNGHNAALCIAREEKSAEIGAGLDKISECALKLLADKEYSYIGVLNEDDETIYTVMSHPVMELQNNTQLPYDVFTQTILNKVPQAEHRRAKASFLLENMQERLSQTNNFRFTISYGLEESERERLCFESQYIDGEKNSLLITGKDVTNTLINQEKKNHELEEALQTAELASNAKSRFMAKMSHEIRTPLNAILGLTEIAKEDKTDQAFVLGCIEKTESAGKYLLSLIDDLLDLTKIENGEVVLSKEPFSGDELINAVSSIFKTEEYEHDLTISIEAKKLEGRTFIGDMARIEQIILTIVSNAIKFSKAQGKISITGNVEDINEHEVSLIFNISDNGIGISEEFLTHIFQPFEQEMDGNTTPYKGCGMGLATAKDLANLMHGDISVESTKGVGSRFSVTLQLDKPHEKGSLPVVSKPIHFDFTGRNVLLCEDNELNIMVARKLLTNKGFAVTVAENGKIGIETFSASPVGFFSLILMDIRMPILDGLSATREIRALTRPDAKNIPIIAMTANAYEEDREKSQEAGMNLHLAKPIQPEALYKALDNALKGKFESWCTQAK